MTQSRSTCAVICGLPGDLQHVGDLKDHKIAKVGGQPVFPGSIPPSDIVISCCTCGNRMALAVQVPRTPEISGPDGILTLWTCISTECAKVAGTWRAFSCHLPAEIQVDRNTGANHSDNTSRDLSVKGFPVGGLVATPDPGSSDEKSDISPGGDPWGTTDDTWGQPHETGTGAGQDTVAFDFSDLEQALADSEQQSLMPASKLQKTQVTTLVSGQQHESEPSCGFSQQMTGPELPGFYLHMTAEAAAPLNMSAEDQHIAELVAAYQNENQQAGPAPVLEGTSEEWSGEAYEEDKAGAFLKFCAQVQHVPQQCVRYSWGGAPIWPKKQKPTAGQCAHCGRQQVFEMQILAPLMHFIEETCTWLLDEEQDCSQQIESAMQVLASWQWLTVAVFTCPYPCQAQQRQASIHGSQCVWQEQTVMLAVED